jgi:phosphoesterase RecJ-like protein
LLNKIDFSGIHQLLTTPKRILLTSHINPDGDAIGSCLALYHFLKDRGHLVNVMVPNHFPEFLAWMEGQDQILIYRNEKEKCDRHFEEAEILFSIDYNDPSRLEEAEKAFNRSTGVKIMIDHHSEPASEFYHHVYSTIETSSTSELVFFLIDNNGSNPISKSIAECLYAGIMTDTGSFSYSCNSEITFRVVSELYKAGIDGVKINKLVYSTFSEQRLRLLGFALSEKLKVIYEYSTAYISLTKEELRRFDFKIGDTEGLVNYALSIKGMKFAALFVEKKDKIRISFRSVGEFSVNDFARKHFIGGGHKNAAGGDSFITLDKTIEKFESLLDSYCKELQPEA